jgi:hypothetical protein
MMQQLQRQDQEMKETNQKLSSLMQHLGFTGFHHLEVRGVECDFMRMSHWKGEK